MAVSAESSKGPMTLGRRQFLISAAVVAGGMALGIAPAPAEACAVRRDPWAPEAPEGSELSAWIEICPDDTVIFRVPTPEIGNGAMTQVAMNITEELECAWSRVRVEFCSIHRDYVDKGVYTSGFLPFFGGHGTDKVRMAHALQLGASARERLKAAAAARWKVPVTEIDAKDSVLTHTKSGRRLRYGEVAAAAAKVKLPAEPALKPESQWTFLGKASPAKLNIPQIVTGKAVYGIDIQVPGMVHAALMQSPVQGGKLKNHKPEAVLGMPGVRAVVVVDPSKTPGIPAAYRKSVNAVAQIDPGKGPGALNKQRATWGVELVPAQSAVAVIADHYWQAKKALEALPVEWDSGPGAKWADDGQIYKSAGALLDDSGGKVLRKSGDVASVKGGKTVEGTYSTPYCENATMEPLNGTAMVTKDGAEVWCPTQDMIQAYWVAIDETGLAPEKVRLHEAYVGGGFGRRTMGDDVRMVVAVAKEYPGVPVKTIWSREECFHQGRYRTPITTQFKAVLGDNGYPEAVTSKAVFVGTVPLYQLTLGYDDQPYFTSGIIPNVHLSSDKFPVNIHDGAFRGPCFNSHAFIVETFIDECAAAAGIDPLDYRLKLMSKWDKSWSDCLRVAAKKAGWGQPLPKGEGRGIAITNWPRAVVHHAGTTMCTVAHVKVTPDGELTVKRVDIAFDCGRVANHDAVRAQIEGGTIFGMNMSLNEQITVANGAIVESNYDRYPMLRLGDRLPEIHVHFDGLSGHDRFSIIGEAPAAPIGPAIGNAIYQATGKRLRTTPFRNHDLRWSF